MEEVVMITEIMAVVDITVIGMIEGIGIMIIIIQESGVDIMIMIETIKVITMGDIAQTIIIIMEEEEDGGIIVIVRGIIKMYQWQSLL